MIRVDVRLLAATNRNLEMEVELGKFRADLYHRLNVYPLKVPPLRDRKEDIHGLAGFFAERTRRKLGLSQVRMDEAAVALLQRYNWPGNVRELENVISRSLLKASAVQRPGGAVVLRPDHLTADLGAAVYTSTPYEELPAKAETRTVSVSLRDEVHMFQIKLITRALERNDRNWAAAARELGMNRSNLHNLATRLGIRKRKEQPRP